MFATCFLNQCKHVYIKYIGEIEVQLNNDSAYRHCNYEKNSTRIHTDL